MADIQLPYGMKDGELVSIDNVERGLSCGCICPECKTQLVANKGVKKTHYFSHYRKSDCNGESLLHYLAKIVFAKRIESAIEEKLEIPIEWECQRCESLSSHKGNLVKVAKRVELEVSVGTCRPDIVLYAGDGRVLAFIEIVVSHFPEEYVFQYCKKNNISLLVIKIETIENVLALESCKNLALAECSECLTRKCSKCKEPLKQRRLHVIDIKCWKCQRPMMMALVATRLNIIHTEEFNEYDLSVARKFDVLIIEQFSKTEGGRYLANTCRSCGAFLGKRYLHDYYGEVFGSGPVNKVLWCDSCKSPFLDVS